MKIGSDLRRKTWFIKCELFVLATTFENTVEIFLELVWKLFVGFASRLSKIKHKYIISRIGKASKLLNC